jgi:hypothetical protein
MILKEKMILQIGEYHLFIKTSHFTFIIASNKLVNKSLLLMTNNCKVKPETFQKCFLRLRLKNTVFKLRYAKLISFKKFIL